MVTIHLIVVVFWPLLVPADEDILRPFQYPSSCDKGVDNQALSCSAFNLHRASVADNSSFLVKDGVLRENNIYIV